MLMATQGASSSQVAGVSTATNKQTLLAKSLQARAAAVAAGQCTPQTQLASFSPQQVCFYRKKT